MRNEKKTVSDLAGDTLAASAFANPTTPHGKHRASGDGRVMTTAANITRAILADRVQRRGRSPKIERARTEGPAFDPFAFTRWRVVAPVGGDPGYLVKTPMRRGAVGWFIACRCCGREFESRGLAFCESCMALPAEERRKPLHGRPCQVPGCMAKISPRRRSDARYCEHHSAGRNGAKVVFSGVKVGRPQAKNTRLRAKFLSKIKGRFSAQKFGRSTSSAVIDAPTISPSTPRSWGQSCNARSPHDADHPGRSRALAARPDRVRSRGLDRSRNGPALCSVPSRRIRSPIQRCFRRVFRSLHYLASASQTYPNINSLRP